MRADILIKINNDKKMREYLINNSYWYKYLNRGSNYYKYFLDAFKANNKEKRKDKTNEVFNTLDTVNTILKIMK